MNNLTLSFARYIPIKGDRLAAFIGAGYLQRVRLTGNTAPLNLLKRFGVRLLLAK
jgi:hypothetical protein